MLDEVGGILKFVMDNAKITKEKQSIIATTFAFVNPKDVEKASRGKKVKSQKRG